MHINDIVRFKVLTVKQALKLASGESVSFGGLTQEEIEEATQSFRNDGWKTIMSFTDFWGTKRIHTSVKEGVPFAIEHTIDLIGEEYPGEPIVHYVHLRLVPLAEVQQYIDDWLPHCKKLD